MKKKKEQLRNFLDGFQDQKIIRFICFYYSLPCGDYRQKRCCYKSIREADLSYQDIWSAVIKFYR